MKERVICMKKKSLCVLGIIVAVTLTVVGGTTLNNINVKANKKVENSSNLKTSAELLDDVLNYSNISDVYLYSAPSESIEAIIKGCSQFRELMSREDYKEVIIDIMLKRILRLMD